ncbi:MAG: AMP-binding protein, partial [Bdellovibrionales bacterium]|nr:AMP-binding protein [Bdellovibrionales bacterium]
SLRSIHVGGALTDCDLFEQAFSALPETSFTHVYGSTEAEPVAQIDAKKAVNESRRAGFFQTLVLGKPIPEVEYQNHESSLWVSGAHVCPRYLGSEIDNQISKRVDSKGRCWHKMGDRIKISDSGAFWFQGRSQQNLEDFQLEQAIYCTLGQSSAFIHRDKKNSIWLLGDSVVSKERLIRKNHPDVHHIEDLSIFRDRRHRSRIDRSTTIQKGAPWLTG